MEKLYWREKHGVILFLPVERLEKIVFRILDIRFQLRRFFQFRCSHFFYFRILFCLLQVIGINRGVLIYRRSVFKQ